MADVPLEDRRRQLLDKASAPLALHRWQRSQEDAACKWF